MNLIVGAPQWIVVLLFLALIAAAIEDALRLRISNITCAAVVILAVVAMAYHGFTLSLWQNAVVFIAILVLGTPAFAAGWFGGGDVKLLAAIGLWLDLEASVGLISTVLIAGGIVAILYIVGRRLLGYEKRTGKIAYGLAIVSGASLLFSIQLHQQFSNPYIEHMQALRQAGTG